MYLYISQFVTIFVKSIHKHRRNIYINLTIYPFHLTVFLLRCNTVHTHTHTHTPLCVAAYHEIDECLGILSHERENVCVCECVCIFCRAPLSRVLDLSVSV